VIRAAALDTKLYTFTFVRALIAVTSSMFFAHLQIKPILDCCEVEKFCIVGARGEIGQRMRCGLRGGGWHKFKFLMLSKLLVLVLSSIILSNALKKIEHISSKCSECRSSLGG
jgi:hypothetical protein